MGEERRQVGKDFGAIPVRHRSRPAGVGIEDAHQTGLGQLSIKASVMLPEMPHANDAHVQ